MNDTNKDKELFVKKYLSPMLVATNVGINSAEYWISNCPQIEYIRLNYSSGKVANVNVTADSLIAMIYDVVKTIF